MKNDDLQNQNMGIENMFLRKVIFSASTQSHLHTIVHLTGCLKKQVLNAKEH